MIDEEYVRPDHYELLTKYPMRGGEIVPAPGDPLMQVYLCTNPDCEAE